MSQADTVSEPTLSRAGSGASPLPSSLVALAVIGILGVGPRRPGVGRWIEDYPGEGGVAPAHRSDLQFARMKAVADNVQYQVYFEPGQIT